MVTNGTVPANVPDQKPMLLARNKIYTFQRTLQGPTISLATAPLDTLGALSVRLADFPNYSELATAYDEYRIMQLQIVFTPTSVNNQHGSLVTAIDYTDAAAPGALSALYEYQTSEISRAGETTDRCFTPQVAIAAYSGAFTSYSLKSAPWISSDYPSVFHYGLKYGIVGISGQASYAAYTVSLRATIQFRSVR
jgi:hypothetical protein